MNENRLTWLQTRYKVQWTREKCLELIEAVNVNTRGIKKVARGEGFVDPARFKAVLGMFSRFFELGVVYDEMSHNVVRSMLHKRVEWTHEKCTAVIEDVKNRGFTEVAKEMGYSNKASLQKCLRDSSIRFGLLSEYESLLNKNGSSSDEK